MRSNQQKSRSRGRSNNSNNRRNSNPLSRSYESNGPDVRVRGNAAHVAEKYVQLARDANQSGDSVAAENYLQHAEHYFRIVSAAQAQVQTQQLAQQAAHQSQQAAQQAKQAELKATQSQNSPESGEGSPGSQTEANTASVELIKPPGGGETEVVNDGASALSTREDASREDTPRTARRPRRRPRTQDRPEAESKPAAATGSDPAGAPQPEAGELPAFVTSTTESSAAE